MEGTDNGAGAIKLGETPTKKLWSPTFIGLLGALIFYPIAAILFIMNWHRMNKTKERNISIIFSIVILIIMILVQFLIENESVLKIVNYGIRGGVIGGIIASQKKYYDDHIANGGGKANAILPTIIAIVIAGAVLYLTLMPIFKVQTDIPLRSWSEGNVNIYYGDQITDAELEAFSEVMMEISFENEVDILFDKENEVHVLGLYITDEEYLKEEGAIEGYRNFGTSIKDVLGYENGMNLKLLDLWGNLIEKIEID